MKKYILSIDQSTQGTKGLLWDEIGVLIARKDAAHAQLIDDKGWIEHNPNEIFANTLAVAKRVISESGIALESVVGVGISNQRETAVAWNRETGEPVYNAIVWQCARGTSICYRLEEQGLSPMIKERTGLHLSPYFSAAKLAWILENVPEARRLMENGKLCMGTVDSWLLFKLTNGAVFKTDYSNASRTQLFNINTLCWDEEVCRLFGIRPEALPEICYSDSLFALCNFRGIFPKPIPIHAMLGDSHGALFGQGCLSPGMIKTTYGTGSSVMMNIGEKPIISNQGAVTSLAWGIDNKINYVLEGNINYTGAVMRWIVEDLGLLKSPSEASAVAKSANPEDETYLVPAFSGLNAPYWDSNAKAMICGMTRITGKAELVRAAEECIAYQIWDIVRVMSAIANIPIESLRVDGGPTKDEYLMQFQSDILQIPVLASQVEELSGMGVAYAAGLAMGIYNQEIFAGKERKIYAPEMSWELCRKKREGWGKAVAMVMKNRNATETHM